VRPAGASTYIKFSVQCDGDLGDLRNLMAHHPGFKTMSMGETVLRLVRRGDKEDTTEAPTVEQEKEAKEIRSAAKSLESLGPKGGRLWLLAESKTSDTTGELV
jgi:hypothetical protein